MNLDLKKDIHIRNPFTVFEVKNFLNAEDYNDLYKVFQMQYFDKNDNGIAKDTFSSTSEKFYAFLSKNPKWKDFINNINSETFIRNAMKSL